MSTIALIVVLSVALLTLLALAGVVLLLVRQVRDLAQRVKEIQTELGPELEVLSREAAIAERELERLTNDASSETDRAPDLLGDGGTTPYTGRVGGVTSGERPPRNRRSEGSPWEA